MIDYKIMFACSTKLWTECKIIENGANTQNENSYASLPTKKSFKDQSYYENSFIFTYIVRIYGKSVPNPYAQNITNYLEWKPPPNHLLVFLPKKINNSISYFFQSFPEFKCLVIGLNAFWKIRYFRYFDVVSFFLLKTKIVGISVEGFNLFGYAAIIAFKKIATMPN